MSKTTKIIEVLNNIKRSNECKKISKTYSNPKLESYSFDRKDDLGYILSDQYNDDFLNDDLNNEYKNVDKSYEYLNNLENEDYFDNQLIDNKINSVFIEYRRIKEEQKLMEKHDQMLKKLIIIKEKYSDYLSSLLVRDSNSYYKMKDKWIYDLITDLTIKPNEKIIYEDKYFILITDKDWVNFDDKESIHLLILPRDTSLRTLRSLKGKDISLLEYMKKNTLTICSSYYRLKSEDLVMYFHYTPSNYHLHIHVKNIKSKNKIKLIGSYDLDTVIFNLGVKPDYYQTIEMSIKKYV